MRILIQSTFWLAFVILLTGCAQQDLDIGKVQILPTKTSSSHTISPEEAIKSMCEFIDHMDIAQSRSTISAEDIAQIIPVSSGINYSRAAEDDTLLYIINFADSAGFAIVSADDRVDAPVLAYAQSGTLPSPDIRVDPPTFQIGHPTTGPGIYTIAKYPGKLFLNPNTIDLYDAEVDDRLVGTFNSHGIPYNNPNATKDTADPLLIGLAKRYVYQTIDNSNIGMVNPDGSSTGGNISTIHTYSNWSKSESVEPLLSKYKFWTQRFKINFLTDIFNYNHPVVTSIKGETKKAAAGCFPLAIAKLMAYSKCPNTYYYNNQLIDWDIINGTLNPENITSEFQKYVSRLTLSIAEQSNALYFYDGTFVFPFRAAAHLKEVGFNNAKKEYYDDNKIVSMLKKNYPLIIYAAPQYWIKKSHAWNIDGYMDITRRHIIKKFEGSKCVQTTEELQLKRYIHCDFGQGIDYYNGYYLSGMFDMDNPYTLDKNTTSPDKYNYDTWIRIITYDAINTAK